MYYRTQENVVKVEACVEHVAQAMRDIGPTPADLGLGWYRALKRVEGEMREWLDDTPNKRKARELRGKAEDLLKQARELEDSV